MKNQISRSIEIFDPSQMHETWNVLGSYYGYPKCCIDYFCENTFNKTMEQRSVHNSTGFVPCHDHAVGIIRAEYNLEDLITNRICKAKFPHRGRERDLDRYINKYFKAKQKQ